jgi:transposase
MPKHRHQEWIKFLQLIRQRTPGDKDVHLIMDNYSAHKDPAVQKWLVKQPRFHVHFTPTSSSWLNMVERFFRALTDKCIRRGVFHDVNELEQTIHHYIDRHNQKPKPYLWTAKATDILEKVKRAWTALRGSRVPASGHGHQGQFGRSRLYRNGPQRPTRHTDYS